MQHTNGAPTTLFQDRWLAVIDSRLDRQVTVTAHCPPDGFEMTVRFLLCP